MKTIIAILLFVGITTTAHSSCRLITQPNGEMVTCCDYGSIIQCF